MVTSVSPGSGWHTSAPPLCPAPSLHEPLTTNWSWGLGVRFPLRWLSPPDADVCSPGPRGGTPPSCMVSASKRPSLPFLGLLVAVCTRRAGATWICHQGTLRRAAGWPHRLPKGSKQMPLEFQLLLPLENAPSPGSQRGCRTGSWLLSPSPVSVVLRWPPSEFPVQEVGVRLRQRFLQGHGRWAALCEGHPAEVGLGDTGTAPPARGPWNWAYGPR